AAFALVARQEGLPLPLPVTARWDDQKLLARFWDQVYRSIDSVYRAHPESAAARIAAHDTVYARAREQLVQQIGPQLRTIDPRYLATTHLDNAVLLAQRIYLTDLDLFDAVYAREGKPFGALDAWVAKADSAGGAAVPGAGVGAAKAPAKQRP
ncbi:MAG: hypothetical protein B7Z72_14615, partial [Gemmatimonadetes bacterium 21-71-4]